MTVKEYTLLEEFDEDNELLNDLLNKQCGFKYLVSKTLLLLLVIFVLAIFCFLHACVLLVRFRLPILVLIALVVSYLLCALFLTWANLQQSNLDGKLIQKLKAMSMNGDLVAYEMATSCTQGKYNCDSKLYNYKDLVTKDYELDEDYLVVNGVSIKLTVYEVAEIKRLSEKVPVVVLDVINRYDKEGNIVDIAKMLNL